MKLILVLSSLLLPLASSSYFQSCEFVECYLFQEEPLITKAHRYRQNLSERDNSIMAVMQRNGLNTMTDLLKRSGVASNLTSSGPFTVFAITDAGFNELRLKAPTWYNTFTTNMTVAAAVLPNYIVNGRVPRTAILPDVFVRAQGGILYFDPVDNGKRMAVNGTSRILKELKASNGGIYVVSNQIIEDIFSMLPLLPNTIGEDLTIMTKALEITGISQMIDDPSDGPFTLFVPTDTAMKALPRGKMNALMMNPQKLKKMLLNHMLPTALFIKEDRVPESGVLKTVGGATIPFRKTEDGKITVGANGAAVIFPNRPGNNGVNHIIDRVIMFDDSNHLGTTNRLTFTTHIERLFGNKLDATFDDDQSSKNEFWPGIVFDDLI